MSSVIPSVTFSGREQNIGLPKVNCLKLAGKAGIIASLALIVLTVALIALSQMGSIHPVSGLIAFSGIIPMLMIVKSIDCCRKRVAKRYGINLEVLDNPRHEGHRHHEIRNSPSEDERDNRS